MKFARRAVAIALNTIAKGNSGAAGRRKRSTKIDPKKFLAEIRKDIGEKNFSKLLGLDGGKTLMFAIDITGSMDEEIESAKAIAIEISTYKRRNPPFNYILSIFGDPVEGTSYKVKSPLSFTIILITTIITTPLCYFRHHHHHCHYHYYPMVV